jgi:putative hydrolase of the HAD superfamily
VLFDAVGTLLFPDPPVAAVYHTAGQRFGSDFCRDEVALRLRAAMHIRQQLSGGREIESAFAPRNPRLSRTERRHWGDAELDALVRPATSELDERERWREVVATVFSDVPQAGGDLFESLWQHFAQPEHWRLYDDVPTSLVRLHEQGYRLAIASNFDCRLHEIVRAHPPLGACERVFVSSELGYAKPDPRFFYMVEHVLSASPEELLLVGDDEVNDIIGARAAGWQVARVDRLHGDLATALSHPCRRAAPRPRQT